jgi:hypothetical protein
MSWEMLCIKHAVLGGLPEDLPSDIAFITERGFNTVLEFLNTVWDHPHPCYFVWCHRDQLERIRKIDHPVFSLTVLKAHPKREDVHIADMPKLYKIIDEID